MTRRAKSPSRINSVYTLGFTGQPEWFDDEMMR